MSNDLKWPRFAVDLPGRGTLQCKAMSPFQSIALADVGADLKDSEAGWCRIGVSIGLTWLDALQRADGEDLAAYGHRVVEDLHGAGWKMGEMGAFVKAINLAMNPVDEVGERADFSEAPEGEAA